MRSQFFSSALLLTTLLYIVFFSMTATAQSCAATLCIEGSVPIETNEGCVCKPIACFCINDSQCACTVEDPESFPGLDPISIPVEFLSAPVDADSLFTDTSNSPATDCLEDCEEDIRSTAEEVLESSSPSEWWERVIAVAKSVRGCTSQCIEEIKKKMNEL